MQNTTTPGFLSMQFSTPFSCILRALGLRFGYGDGYSDRRPGLPMSGCGGRLLIGLLIAGFALFQYFSHPSEMNSFTGREQKLDLSPQEEIQLGLASRSEMADTYGGLSHDAQAAARVKRVGQNLVAGTSAHETEYQFDFHLLADRQTVNAFALPGGQIFITEALYRLLNTTNDDELAGVLGHEIGHVVGRHSSEQIAKSKLLNGLTTGVVIATSDDHGNRNAQLAMLINQLVTMKYGRNDEIEADKLGVRFLLQSGYDPEAMIRVMEVLKRSSGGRGPPEFMSTHPSPENRIGLIKEEIEKQRKVGR